MNKVFQDIKNFWHNYRANRAQLKPLARFIIAIVVHVFKLPTCSWQVNASKIELVLFAGNKRRADEIMAYVEKLDKKVEDLKAVMR